MTTAADKIKANAERLRHKPDTTATTGQEPLPDVVPAPNTRPSTVRQKTVRRTVDLSPSTHRNLDNWQRDTAERLGLARVTGQEVLIALVDQLLSRPDLSEQVVHIIAAQRS